MAIQADIPLGVRPVQIPDVGRQFIEAQGLAQERQLRGLQIHAATRANELADADAKDLVTARGIYTSSGGDPEKTVQGLIAAGVSPKLVQSTQQHFADYAQKVAQTEKDKLPVREYQNKQYLGIIGKAKQQLQEDPEGFAQNYPQYLQAVAQIDPKEAAKLPTQPPTLDQLNMAEAAHGTDQYFIEQAKAKREAEELNLKQKEGERQATLFPSQLTSAQSKATIDQAEAQGINMSPVAAKQKVDAVIDPVKYPEKNARALAMFNNAVTVKDKNAALDKVASEIGDVEKETNPQIRAAHVQQAVDTENAVAPLRTAQAVNLQKALIPGEVSKAISIESATNPLKLQQARASAGATAGTREALKLDQDYVKIAGATDQIGKLLDLADQGNKAAGSALSTVGAMSLNAVNGLRRLNRNEIEGVGGSQAGNAYDHIVGFFDKATEGQPIPPNIRNDIRTLHQVVGENAYKEYTTGLDALSKRSGTSYAPTVAAPNINKTAAASSIPDAVKNVLSGASVGVHTLSDGSVWKKLADGTIEKQ